MAWTHRQLLQGRPSRILDLGCGPGFYAHHLAKLGHRCLGTDFGPASIEYANQNKPDSSRCDFVLGDVRQADLGGPYDLAMMLYGELNVFAPEEAALIVRKVHASLVPGGWLIVEVQTRDAVEQLGRREASEYSCESGLFSDQPHHCRAENQWLADHLQDPGAEEPHEDNHCRRHHPGYHQPRDADAEDLAEQDLGT